MPDGLSEQTQILMLREELQPIIEGLKSLNLSLVRMNGRVQGNTDTNTGQDERLETLEDRVGDTQRMKLIERERMRTAATVAFGVSGVVSLIAMLIVVFFVA